MTIRISSLVRFFLLWTVVFLSPPLQAQGGEPIRQLIVCGWDEVFILDLNQQEQGRPRKIWSWRAAETDLPAEIQELLKYTDECKPIEGGRKVLVTSSGGGAVLVERSQGKVLFYGRAANAHSAELLPGGRVAVAASHDRRGGGDRLIVFDLDRSDRELFSEELPWGHGVVWDERRQLLWVLAGEDIRVFRLRDWDTDSPGLDRVAVIPLPDSGGHDLYPADEDSLVVTTDRHCWLFDRNSRVVTPHPQLKDHGRVKGVSRHPVTGELVFVQAEGGHWWSERLRFVNPGSTIHLPGERLYKARWIVAE